MACGYPPLLRRRCSSKQFRPGKRTGDDHTFAIYEGPTSTSSAPKHALKRTLERTISRFFSNELTRRQFPTFIASHVYVSLPIPNNLTQPTLPVQNKRSSHSPNPKANSSQPRWRKHTTPLDPFQLISCSANGAAEVSTPAIQVMRRCWP